MNPLLAGVHQIPLQDYVHDPAPSPSLNTSTAVALLEQSPLHAKLQHPRLNPEGEKRASSRADLGSIAHALLLEEDKSRVVEIDAEDWRTNAAKEQRDAAWADGKLPILRKDYAAVVDMVKAAQMFLMGSELCEEWFSATPEQTLLWQDDGVWCRSRPDKLSPDGRVYFDYKTTTSAHPAAFAKTAINQGYDLQAALGARGVKVLFDVECTVVFVVQEIDPPHLCSLVSLSPMFRAIADERLELARVQWGRCLRLNHWPGYPDKLATIDPPGWYGHDQVEGL